MFGNDSDTQKRRWIGWFPLQLLINNPSCFVWVLCKKDLWHNHTQKIFESTTSQNVRLKFMLLIDSKSREPQVARAGVVMREIMVAPRTIFQLETNFSIFIASMTKNDQNWVLALRETHSGGKRSFVFRTSENKVLLSLESRLEPLPPNVSRKPPC